MSTLLVNNIKSLISSSGNPITIEDSIKNNGSSVINDSNNSIAFGQDNSTIGVAAVSLAGRYNTASNYAATIAGNNTSATAFHAVAMGVSTSATGTSAFAHGRDTIGSGQYSHVEGRDAVSSGQYSHAEGQGTIASASYQHAQGKYNVADTDENTLMIIGNGTGDGARKNLAKFATASFILDEDALPTLDPGVAGQLYTTSSARFGGDAALKVLMVST